MNSLSIPVLSVLCVVVGSVIAWLILRTRSAVLRQQVTTLEQTLATVQAQLSAVNAEKAVALAQIAGLNATLQNERNANAEKLALVDRASKELRDAFQTLAAEALKSNNESFLHLAKTSLEKFQGDAQKDLAAREKAVEGLVAPIKESLGKVDEQIQQMEKARSQAYGTLTEQVRSLVSTQEQLRGETSNLVKALRAPAVRGRWGEIQLKRVVEMAGMLSYCDFVEQDSVQTSEGRLRPDLIVKLPGGKNVVVDAKTPLEAYLRAVETNDDAVRRACLEDHARQVRAHMSSLSSKAYWEQFESSPEFVIMFLPGEMFFSAALEQDPSLIEEGVNQRVIPSSPTTLIALLRAVAYGWRQEKLARNAQEISNLGKELHDRLRSMVTHMENLKKSLDRAVDSYNKMAGSFESRVLVSARRFPELGAAVTEEIPEVDPIETTTRTLSPELEDGEAVKKNTLQMLPLGDR